MEKTAMRKRYGLLTSVLLALLVLSVGTKDVLAQSFIPYPSLSLRNFHLPPGDGLLRVVPPSNGTNRYFLVPVWVYNSVDTTQNPNNSWLVCGNPNCPPGPGQHLEPIRSFQFQVWYNNEVMQLDTLHGSPIVMNGPSIVSEPGQSCPVVTAHTDTALATSFFVTADDQSANDPNNPFSHVIRVAGASSVPLVKNNNSDTGYTEHNGILCWLRFVVVPGPAPGGDMHLDSIRFNDHAGDTGTNTVGSLDFTHGNMGGGMGQGGAIDRGQLSISYLNSGPSFELRPLPNFTLLDGANGARDSLNNDLVYDPTVFNGQVAQSFVLDDGIAGTELDNVTITSGAPWLNVNCGTTPEPGKTSIFLGWDAIDGYNLGEPIEGQANINLWLTVPNPQALPPGIYYSTVTFSNPDAVNSPMQLVVRFVREAAPDEPTPGGTGIQLQLTNSCNPSCTSLLTFGTGSGATDWIDELYGEEPVTSADTAAWDALGQCYAFFVPGLNNPNSSLQDSLTADNYAGISRDIRDSITDTTLIYQVDFNPGNVNCYPVKVCVDTTQFPAGARVLLKFTLNGSDQPIDLRNATISSSGLECVTITDHTINHFYIEYTPGTIASEAAYLKPNAWSLVSLPVIPPNPDAGPPNGPNFAHALTVPYDYQEFSGWEQSSTMEFGRGYMIRYGSYIGSDNVVAGIRSFTVSGVQISEGWNSVGATSGTGMYNQSGTAADGTVMSFQPIATGAPVPNALEDALWEFTPTMGYDMTNFFEPGRGYFIKVDNPGFYNLSTPVPTSGTKQQQAPAGKVAERENLMGQLTQVTLSDADGNGQALYFGNATTTESEGNFEMPSNFRNFDARFNQNSGMVSFNHTSYLVDLHATSYPVTMKFSNAAGEVTVSDMHGNVLGTSSNGIVTITSAVSQVQIAEKQPDAPNMVGFALQANTPNPFTGVTSIGYSLPQESAVSMVVYNELGQVVQTLVSGTVEAGQHTAIFDGSQLPSGTYFCTIKAGNFVQTESMTLNRQ